QLRRNGVAGAHLGTRALAPILAEQRVLQLGDPRVAVGVGNLVDLGDLDALDLDPELLEKQEELLEGADAESLHAVDAVVGKIVLSAPAQLGAAVGRCSISVAGDHRELDGTADKIAARERDVILGAHGAPDHAGTYGSGQLSAAERVEI